MSLYTRRRIVNQVGLTLSVLATLFGLFWLVWLLWTLFGSGLRWIGPKLFLESTPPPGASGGLANAIVGSVILTIAGVGMGAPAGILAGTYLAEFGRTSRLGAVVRFVNDILLSAPSIIIGVFVYGLIVLRTGHFSGWAGAVALALIVMPVVVRTTENMMRLVPDSLREAAAALGSSELEGHDGDRVPQRSARHPDRGLAWNGPSQRRNRTVALHRPQQPVLEHRYESAICQFAGGDLPVRHEPV